MEDSGWAEAQVGLVISFRVAEGLHFQGSCGSCISFQSSRPIDADFLGVPSMVRMQISANLRRSYEFQAPLRSFSRDDVCSQIEIAPERGETEAEEGLSFLREYAASLLPNVISLMHQRI